MRFHLCLATLPPVYRESLGDTVALISAGLIECGHRLGVDDTRAVLDGSAINLFVADFDAEAANSLIATKRAKGADFPLGLVLTHAPDDPDTMSGEFSWRGDNVRRVADVADFVWYLKPGLERLPEIADPAKCALWEIGYSGRFAFDPEPTRDIDFFLPGYPYPYRQAIVDRLAGRGYRVRCGDLATPAYIHRSLMARAKAVLDIRRSAATPTLSPVRIAVAAASGIAIVSERFDTSALAELYAYTLPAEADGYVERCVRLIETEDHAALGMDARVRFAAERPLRPRLERLLAAPPLQTLLGRSRDGR